MSKSTDGQQPEGRTSGKKDRKEKPKADAERRAFHRQQLQNPDILMPDLDPDKPVPLGGLQRFDDLICTRLRMLGYPGTGKTDRPPQSCRPMVLARKLAGNSQSLSQAEIAVLADRIGWLQRNCFRWSVRNGYAEYFASREAKSSSDNSDKIGEIAASDPAPPERRNASNEPKDCQKGFPNTAIEDAFSMIKKLDELSEADLTTPASAKSISASERPPLQAASLTSDRLSSVESGGGSDWTSLAAEVRRRRPQEVPQKPQRPRTFGKEFPIPKAKALLIATALEKPIAEQIEKARVLLNDREELRSALAHSIKAREDLLDIFANLGLDL